MKKNIVLIGMPSCGKSTVGVLLAKELGYNFIDTDIVIQEREGKRLDELIEELGLEGFILLENEVISSINTERTVIATGGSAVYGEEGITHLKKDGTVIYLKISYKTLTQRLFDYLSRGVVLPREYTLKDMYDERAVLYEYYADYTVDESLCDGVSKTVKRVSWICRDLQEEENGSRQT